MDNPAILLRRLNPYSARAMEGAASLCQTRSHAEILPEHWLLKLLEQGEGDLTVLARRYTWDMDAIWQDLLTFMDKLPRSVRSRPQLSDAIQTLMQEAWLRASLEGEEQIRSLHLLMALVEKPSLIRCDGLWPLLTLAQSQLERLHPVLDAQSDERLEVQQVERLRPSLSTRNDDLSRDMGVSGNNGLSDALRNALDKFTLDVTARARDGKIDPVFGRDNEIRQMVDILSRRRKNNPILVGEPGVGKTALVEGLALRVAEGNVPDSLKPVSVRTLDLGLLQAGAGVKGEFEQRLKNIIEAVQQSPLSVPVTGNSFSGRRFATWRESVIQRKLSRRSMTCAMTRRHHSHSAQLRPISAMSTADFLIASCGLCKAGSCHAKRSWLLTRY